MTQYAPASPTAYAIPYQYRESGPSWRATALGVQSIIAAECTRDRPRGLEPYPSGLMAEFQWWLLLVGLVAGGGLVAVVTMDGRRREEDIERARAARRGDLDRRAARGSRTAVDARDGRGDPAAHREYLVAAAAGPAGRRWPGRRSLDRDPDGVPDEVGDDGRRGADEDLPRAREQQAPAGQEAHAGADREQRRDR